MQKIATLVASVFILAGCAGTMQQQGTAEAVAPKPAPVAKPKVATVHDHKKEVVSYIRTWAMGTSPEAQDAGRHWTAEEIDGDQLTTLNISFGLIRNDTEVYIKDLEPQPTSDKKGTIPPFSTLWTEVDKLQQKYPDLRINLSIGGYGADGFSQLAKAPESRAKFIANVMKIVEEHKLSGVDIDWEYPVGPDWDVGIFTHPRDRTNYPVLLEEIRAAFDKLGAKTGKTYRLSVAVPVGPWFTQKNDILRVAKAVDFIKVMTYDMYGGWSKWTGHHANLYQRTDDPAWGGISADQGIKVYLNYGIDPKKLLLGAAFYGYSWSGVPDKDHGLFQTFKKGGDPVSFTDAKVLMTQGYTRYWDDVAKSPWLYNGDVFVSYEDEESMKAKAAYANEKDLGGIMIWEYAHDMSGDLVRAINKGLVDTKK
ncbi:Chitinase A1 [Andreprevotia sp. IGB-42]|uniref:glycoside hydrolase family 18 protein n=1 Tax=Andreprevotia sp. IGB-42 TaxID=2497473 RepID=UPI00135B1388|nr:glycoside hydrolase family 18 protein [Andreprevotia sp. IGB-42]KAF0814995.1 Chitinase A1 [Andreprevotia sp. IGB-42]